MTREHKVHELMDAASLGMLPVAESATGTEVFAAYVMLAANAIQYAKETGTPVEKLRGIIEQMLLRLDDPNGRKM